MTRQVNRDWFKFYLVCGFAVFVVSMCLCCVIVPAHPTNRHVRPVDIVGTYRYQYYDRKERRTAQITFNSDLTFLQQFPDAGWNELKEHRGTWKIDGPRLQMEKFLVKDAWLEPISMHWEVVDWLWSSEFAIAGGDSPDPDMWHVLQREP